MSAALQNGWSETPEQALERWKRQDAALSAQTDAHLAEAKQLVTEIKQMLPPRPSPLSQVIHAGAQAFDAIFEIPMKAGFWKALVVILAIALATQLVLLASELLIVKSFGG